MNDIDKYLQPILTPESIYAAFTGVALAAFYFWMMERSYKRAQKRYEEERKKWRGY